MAKIIEFLKNLFYSLKSNNQKIETKETDAERKSLPEMVNNDAKRYFYQLNVKHSGSTACNVSSCSMITGIDANRIDDYIKEVMGKERTDPFTLKAFIERQGYSTKELCFSNRWSKNVWIDTPNDSDFSAMREFLKSNSKNLILYGFQFGNSGHFGVLKGYEFNVEKSEFDYIFNDPAGNRNVSYFNGDTAGENVRYSESDLKRFQFRSTVLGVIG